MEWKFYGRQTELAKLSAILKRNRWFFAKITGRRRIGKTRLIQQALGASGGRPVFYVQIPDSAPSGVMAAVDDAIEAFQIDRGKFGNPRNLLDLAKFISGLAQAGYIIALDEFQYFNRTKLKEFCSYLQNEVDQLSSKADSVKGGLFVLGSIHTEMMAILEERSAPLYNRVTDEVAVSHWEISSLLQIFDEFGVTDPKQILFFWNLFEGIPKFYRDCFEQGVLSADRATVIKKMFFDSSSPLRTEAENWFLKELHGRYDTVLKYIARHSGCTNSDLESHIRQVSPESEEQVGGHLQTLQEKYGLIERRLPIFSKPTSRKGRYYITDNFLRSWLAALSAPVSAVNFSLMDRLLIQANEKLRIQEGYSLEKLAGVLYAERSRKGIGDFQLTHQISGYWDRSNVEIDLIALDADSKKIRFGSCKRSGLEHLGSAQGFIDHANRFLKEFPEYQNWTIQYVAISPEIPSETGARLRLLGIEPQDFSALFNGLRQK